MGVSSLINVEQFLEFFILNEYIDMCYVDIMHRIYKVLH